MIQTSTVCKNFARIFGSLMAAQADVSRSNSASLSWYRNTLRPPYVLGYGAELARHLMNPRDNDHVTLHRVEGFLSHDLASAFSEAEMIASGTRCRQYLFSMSFNPPSEADVPVEVFEQAISDAEARLGLSHIIPNLLS